ncbi:KAD4 kinase, partial [Panurus biarmicus]|nr:KAD4 kinase [Panurus biarmicus]
MASKLLRAVVLGPPGSGKGTVCERIARSFGLQHLSSGQFLRESLGGGGGECPRGRPVGTGSGGTLPAHPRTGATPAMGRDTSHCPRVLPPGLGHFQGCDSPSCSGHPVPGPTLPGNNSCPVSHPSLPSGTGSHSLCPIPPSLGVDDLTGEPLVQREDDRPEAVAARLRKYKDAAKPVIELYKSRGILHSFSGTETNKIWPYVYALLSSRIPPVLPDEEH